MANEVTCPTCTADIPLGGDERNGDDIFCTACGATCTLKGNYGEDELEAEEDF